jgi:hypothetical protein
LNNLKVERATCHPLAYTSPPRLTKVHRTQRYQSSHYSSAAKYQIQQFKEKDQLRKQATFSVLHTRSTTWRQVKGKRQERSPTKPSHEVSYGMPGVANVPMLVQLTILKAVQAVIFNGKAPRLGNWLVPKSSVKLQISELLGVDGA